MGVAAQHGLERRLIAIDEHGDMGSDATTLIHDVISQPRFPSEETLQCRRHAVALDRLGHGRVDRIGQHPGESDRDTQRKSLIAPILGKEGTSCFQVSPLSMVSQT